MTRFFSKPESRPNPRLPELEAVIQRGLDAMQAFAAAGNALAEIRDQKFYTPGYASFDAYLQGRWAMSKSHAYRLIEAAGVLSDVLMSHTWDATPNLRQAGALAPVPPPLRAEAWQTALDTAPMAPTGEKLVTADHVAQVAEQYAPKKRSRRRTKKPRAVKLRGPGWRLVLTRTNPDVSVIGALQAALHQLQQPKADAA